MVQRSQVAVSLVEDWSNNQNIQLNDHKYKAMAVDFKQRKHFFNPHKVDGKELRTVDSAKVLGLTLSSDLNWNKHITESIKKVNKLLYFFVLLRRPGYHLRMLLTFIV